MRLCATVETGSSSNDTAIQVKPPVFIVGSQRSGTTLLRLMLNAHPNIAIPNETVFIPEFYYRAAEFGDLRQSCNVERLVEAIYGQKFVQKGRFHPLSPPDVAGNLRERTYAGVVRALFEAYAHSNCKERWGDKSPGEPQLALLATMFPDARFIHLIRDGRDVALSCLRSFRRGAGISQLAHTWAWFVSTVRREGRTIADRYLEMRYEDLVANPQGALEAICRHIDEPFDPLMLDYHRRNAAKDLPVESLRFHRTSILPPDPSKVYEWKLKMKMGDCLRFQRITGDLLSDLGYTLLDDNSVVARSLLWLCELRDVLNRRSVFRSPALKAYGWQTDTLRLPHLERLANNIDNAQ